MRALERYCCAYHGNHANDEAFGLKKYPLNRIVCGGSEILRLAAVLGSVGEKLLCFGSLLKNLP